MRALSLALFAALALAGVAELAAKPGRVIRIERATLRPGKDIRLCQYSQYGPTAQLTCYGSPQGIAEGNVFEVIGEDGSFARAEVLRVRPQAPDACNLTSWVEAEARAFDQVSAPASSAGTYYVQTAVSGIELVPGVSKLLSNTERIQSPSGNPNEAVFVAIDISGDDQADFVGVTVYDCREAQKNLPWVPSGHYLSTYCFVYYERDGLEWTKSSTTVMRSCS